MYIPISKKELNLYLRQMEHERKMEQECEHEWSDIGPYLICMNCGKRKKK